MGSWKIELAYPSNTSPDFFLFKYFKKHESHNYWLIQLSIAVFSMSVGAAIKFPFTHSFNLIYFSILTIL